MNSRIAKQTRISRETRIEVELDLDNPGERDIDTSLPFLDHMLDAFACHGEFGLRVAAEGDIQVDPHHLVEDLGIVLGRTVKQACGGYENISRSGFFIFLMDCSQAQVAMDLCGRPNLVWNVELSPFNSQPLDPSLFREFFKGFVDNAGATLHINVPYLDNNHHAIEAVFKGFGKALKMASSKRESKDALSTKGVFDG